MGKTDPLLPCPHCGSEMRAGSLKRHAPICVKNPVAAARYCEVLRSAPTSRRGITCNQYVALSAADPALPTVVTLRRLTGCKRWPAVLAVFGLEPPPQEQLRSQCMHCGKFVSGGAAMADHLQECLQKIIDAREAAKAARAAAPRKPRKPINIFAPRKPRTPKAPTTCPVCNMQRIDMRRHVCPEDPAVVAWLAAHLPDPGDPGRIITCQAYRQIEAPAISYTTVSRAYGNWSGLAARYGLEVRGPRKDTDGAPQLDPATLAELRRLADELHDGAFGPSTSEYDTYRSPGAIMTHGLQHRHGTWADVLALAGLRAGTMSEYQRASITRRKAHQASQASQNERRSRGNFDRGDEPISREYTGLPVLPNPRTLASGGVAWTVR